MLGLWLTDDLYSTVYDRKLYGIARTEATPKAMKANNGVSLREAESLKGMGIGRRDACLSSHFELGSLLRSSTTTSDA